MGRGPQRGAVHVELLVVFLPILMLVLCLVQLTLIYVGKATTQRAANAAVRAAVVVLDDDPRYYGGAPRNVATGARLEAIRHAAVIPLSSLSAASGTVERAVGVGDAGLGASLASADRATTVSFPGGARFGLEQDVTVKVTHRFRCGVPLGRWILCARGGGDTIELHAEATLPNQGARYAY
jgi:Flp pilus assembly protein TadG